MLQLRAPYTPPIVAHPRVRTGFFEELACCGAATANVRTGWASDPSAFDLHHADASRFGARKELLLLEDHLAHEKCPECVYKHLDRAVAFLDEARTLDGGDGDDSALAARLSALSPRIGDAAAEIRDVRRELGARLGRGGRMEKTVVSGIRVGASLAEEWSDDDLVELADIAARSRILDSAYLLKVMASESGLHPWAAYRVDSAGKATKDKSGYPYASGLIQLTKAANEHVGITEEERADVVNWSVAEQLPLVDRYYSRLPWTKAGRDYDSAAAVYFANFAGSRMMSRGTAMDTVIYSSGVDDGPTYSEINDGDAYWRNKGFDLAKKGYITVQDLANHLDVVEKNPAYQEALARLRDVAGYPEASSTPWWKYVLGGLFVAGVGVYAVVR